MATFHGDLRGFKWKSRSWIEHPNYRQLCRRGQLERHRPCGLICLNASQTALLPHCPVRAEGV
jgi:hypothetical protein